MKRLTNAHFPLEIDVGQADFTLDDVRKILFKFQQGSRSLIWEYPSDTAKREVGTNVVLLKWTPEQTALFSDTGIVKMDTMIYLNCSDDNPETDIVEFRMSPTLFTIEEVASGD